MPNKFQIFFCSAFLMLSLSFFAFASTEKTDEHNEMSLSEEAIKNYGIKTVKVSESDFVTLPRSAFVASKNQYFVYAVEHDGFVELSPHKLQKMKDGFMFVNEHKLHEFVVEGAKYLRMINLSQKSPASGHSH